MDVQLQADDLNTKPKWSKNICTLSVICSILVIFIHTYNVESYEIKTGIVYWLEIIVSQNIARIAVPYFFISSGFLLFRKKRSYTDVLKTKFHSIFIPYICWNVIYMIVFTVFGAIGIVNREPFQFGIKNIILELFFYKSNYAFWFIYQIILLIILFPVISKGANIKIWESMIILFTMIVVYLVFGDFIPYNGPYLICFSALIYYFIGAIIGNNQSLITDFCEKHIQNRRTILILISIFIALASFITIDVMKIQCLYNLDIFRNLSLLYLLWELVNTFQINFSGWITKITFLIYAIHPLLLECIEKLIYKVFPKSTIGAIIDYCFAPIITLLLIFVITKIWSRLFPKIFKICSGGR